MAQILQASCPGCKSVLRFPSEWLGQALRCKQCSTLMQTVAPPTQKPARSPSSTPPPPQARLKKSPPPLPVPKAPAAKPPVAKPPVAKAPPALPAPPAAIKPASPVATAPPVAARAKSGNSLFDFDTSAGSPQEEPASPRKPRGSGTPWVGLGLTLALLAVTTTLGVMFWPKIQQALKEANLQAQVEEDGTPPVRPSKEKTSVSSTPNPEPRPKEKVPAVTDKDKMVVKDKDKTPTPSDKDKTPAPSDKDKSTPMKDKDKAMVMKDKEPDKDKTPPPPPKDNPKVTPPKDKDKEVVKVEPPVPKGTLFPRRVLIVSVHNYLYANPVMPGQEGASAVPGAVNMPPALVPALTDGLKIPLTQVYHVSDTAKKNPLPPLKPVIEQSVRNFLATSREMDRVMVFFIGHTKEIDGKPYLVPLEGDFKDPSSLIPLEWMYQQLQECKARQKIFVLDGNRYNAAQGEERPVSGEMSEKFEAMLKSPPEGIEVFASCSKGEQSREFDGAPLGVFLDTMRRALMPDRARGEKGPLDGTIQKPDDLIPMSKIAEGVVADLTLQLEKRKLKQTPIFAGKPPADGAAYDRTMPLAKDPAFPTFQAEDQATVRNILTEISVPPIKGGRGTGADLSFGSLPPFSSDALKKYDGALAADHKVRTAIQKARVAMWAISTANSPADVQEEVAEVRKKANIKDINAVMKDRFKVPAQEKQFKDGIEKDSRELARLVFLLEEAEDNMRETAETDDFKAAPARWKANFVYIWARIQAQLTYIEEYNSLLGQMRKEYPPYEQGVHSGWRMAAKDKTSDSAARKYLKKLREKYGELIKEHKGSPWEVLGKREELTALGLEWQAF